jgi:hypothetical protein
MFADNILLMIYLNHLLPMPGKPHLSRDDHVPLQGKPISPINKNSNSR